MQCLPGRWSRRWLAHVFLGDMFSKLASDLRWTSGDGVIQQIQIGTPFMQYEGLRDKDWHAQRIAEMTLWLKRAKILGTDLIQIPSTFLNENTLTGRG